MAGSINKAVLIGNLGKDPEVRATQSGSEIATLTIATSESWKDKSSGERKEKTEWHRVILFNENLVRVAKEYLRKGSKVYLEGQIQTRKWTNKEGQDQYSTEIVLQAYGGTLVMLDGPKKGDDAYEEQRTAHGEAKSDGIDLDLNDELGF